jgi:PAS domain S-box-containing protein
MNDTMPDPLNLSIWALANPQELVERLVRILDATASEVYFLRADTLQFLEANRAALSNSGYSLEELRQLSPRELAVGFNPEVLATRLLPLRNGEQDELAYETKHRRKDGTTYPVELWVLMSRLNGDEVFVGVANDITSRRQTERALKESQERLELAVLGANLGTWADDLSNSSTIYDSRAQDIIGRRVEGALPDNEFATLVHPDDAPNVALAWFDHLRGISPFYMSEFRIRGESGQYAWIRSRGRVVERDADGRATRAAGIYIDATHERETESALRESQGHLELAVRGAELGTWSTDLRARTTTYDERVAEIIGRRVDGPIPNGIYDGWIHPDDQAATRASWIPHLRGETPLHSAEFRILGDNGRYRWLRSRGRVVERDAEGRAARAAGIYIDITGEKEAQNALAASEADITAMFSSSPDAIAILSPSLDILRINPAAREAAISMWNLRLREGDNLAARLDPVSAAHMAERVDQVLTTDRQLTLELEVETNNGLLWHEFSYKPVRLDDGTVRGVAMLFRNIHQRKLAEAALVQGQKLESLGLLAGGVAHDFNNLLVGVLGNASFALEQLPEHSAVRAAIEDVVTAAERAADLARQMLAYSGKARVDACNVDVNRVVAEMTKLLRASIPRNVEVNVTLERGLPVVQGDPTQLGQVVMNLVVNASDAMNERGGVVTVTTATTEVLAETAPDGYVGGPPAAGRYAVIRVADNGSGMEEATVARIFDPFFTTKPAGRGLGLAAVVGIVRGHGGALRVASRAGVGSAFDLLLPLAETGAEAPIAPAPQVAWRGNGLVLVVDDEPVVRTLTARALASFGFDSLQADDGKTGVEMFAANPEAYTCVLLDMTMPRLNGEGTFDAIRALRPDVPVLMLSGYGDEETMLRMGQKSLSGFVQKPFRIEQLRDALKSALDQAPA